MKKIVTTIMAIVMILSVMSVPALADSDINIDIDVSGDGNTVIVNTGDNAVIGDDNSLTNNVNNEGGNSSGNTTDIDFSRVINIWHQGELRATGYLDSYSEVYVSSQDLLKIFVEETGNWMTINEQEFVSLQKWATVFGYTMELVANNCFLFAKEDGGIIEVPETIKVFRDNEQILGISLSFSDEDQTIFGDKNSLRLIFPELEGKTTIETPEAYTLQYWADTLGYKMEIDHLNVYLTSPVVLPTPEPEPVYVARTYSLLINNVLTDIFPMSKEFPNREELHVTSAEAAKIFDMFGISIVNKPTEIRDIAIRCGLNVYATNNAVYLYDANHRPINVNVNGKNVVFDDIGPTILNGRTLLPVRATANALGAEVDWNNELRMVTITKGTDTIRLFIDSVHYMINENILELDVAPCIINSRTMLPIRAIAEALGYKVSWNGDNLVGVVSITNS
ncbi:MAG: copper amine oxidase N-terminal domain-containing protein [Clostridia bacterium]|nr:copper amine oxidase N-terminal domain-containing protein [Clostridia bacterium]